MKTYMLFAYSICAILTGCATPPVEYKSVEVKVPVAVPCAVTLPDVPKWARSGTSKESNIDELAKAHVAELIQREAYEGELKATVAGCK